MRAKKYVVLMFFGLHVPGYAAEAAGNEETDLISSIGVAEDGSRSKSCPPYMGGGILDVSSGSLEVSAVVSLAAVCSSSRFGLQSDDSSEIKMCAGSPVSKKTFTESDVKEWIRREFEKVSNELTARALVAASGSGMLNALDILKNSELCKQVVVTGVGGAQNYERLVALAEAHHSSVVPIPIRRTSSRFSWLRWRRKSGDSVPAPASRVSAPVILSETRGEYPFPSDGNEDGVRDFIEEEVKKSKVTLGYMMASSSQGVSVLERRAALANEVVSKRITSVGLGDARHRNLLEVVAAKQAADPATGAAIFQPDADGLILV